MARLTEKGALDKSFGSGGVVKAVPRGARSASGSGRTGPWSRAGDVRAPTPSGGSR